MKELRTEIVHKKCVTIDSMHDFKPSEIQSTDNESRRLTKVPKTSAERGREFRARKALLKKQCKQQQEQVNEPPELTAIEIKRAKSAESKRKQQQEQVNEPPELTAIEIKRAKSAESKRRRREKKKQAKTAAQRMREYRERKKLRKQRMELINRSDFDKPHIKPKIDQDPAESKNEIKVFCPKCGTQVSHTAQGIKEDQTKIFIAKTYHYFEQEYEELKIIYGDLDLTPLSKFCQRTALATGVSEQTVLQILKEEETRNAGNSEEHILSRAGESSMHTDSFSDEDSPDDNDAEPSYFNVAETMVVKVEPEDYNIDEPEIHYPTIVKQELGDSEVTIDEPEIHFPTTVKQELSDSEVKTYEPEIHFLTAVKQEPSDSEVKTYEPEIHFLTAVKQEPSHSEVNTEQPLIDPISLHVKTEPRRDIWDKSCLIGEVEVKVDHTEIGE